jgi:tRNA(Ile)-lysidine synthase
MLVNSDDDAALRQTVGQKLADVAMIGVAVSGGSDSMALLDLIFRTCPDRLATVGVATVNHGLRAGAEAEARTVAAFCAARDIAHVVLHWNGSDSVGNVQNAAREARYRLLAGWAKDRGAGVVALGHTEDDQAETFLMRLSREAGVDGLSGMPAKFERHGVMFARPLLDIGRRRLRAYLQRQGIGWADDPSNDDAGYERVRVRHILAALNPLGIDAETLCRVAGQIDAARRALVHVTRITVRNAVTEDRGNLLIDVPRLNAQPADIRRRVILAAIKWITSSTYPPRRDDMERLMAALDGDMCQTLAGCLIERRGNVIGMFRETNAVRDTVSATDRIWDGRWRIDGPHDPALQVRALGEAIKDCPEWRQSGLPRAALMASPAIWQGETLIAAPLAGLQNGWTARIVAEFASSLVTH